MYQRCYFSSSILHWSCHPYRYHIFVAFQKADGSLSKSICCMCHSLRSLSTAVHLSTAQDAIKNAASLRGPLVEGWCQQKLGFGVLGYAGYLGCCTYTWIDLTTDLGLISQPTDLGLISQRMRVISPCLWQIFHPNCTSIGGHPMFWGWLQKRQVVWLRHLCFRYHRLGPGTRWRRWSWGWSFGRLVPRKSSSSPSISVSFQFLRCFFLIRIFIFLRFAISNQHPHFWRIPPFFREYSHSSGPFPHQVAIHLTPNSPRKTTTFTTIAWNQI